MLCKCLALCCPSLLLHLLAVSQSLAWCSAGWEQRQRIRHSKALESGAAWALQAGKTTPTRNTHLFLGKQLLGLSMEGDQHGQSASWPPGGVASQQWPGNGLCCWQQDGAALAAETHTVGPSHSHPVYLPTE